MPTRNVNLTEELDRYVASKVSSGRYDNASEVMRASLRALEREEREEQAKIDAIRGALEDGERSGLADDGVFDRVRAKLTESAQR
jgi:antitoxin ParD1/3/4